MSAILHSSLLDDDENHPLQHVHNSLNQITSLEDVEHALPFIRSAMYYMNNVKLDHLGLNQSYVDNLIFGQCMSIFESRDFDIAVFILPKGFTLQLHDHPHMFVCTKLLAGSISVRSFSSISSLPNDEILGKLEIQTTKSNYDDAWYLTPDQGNYHEITATENCVMLDVLLPPYHDEQGRPCTFYSAAPRSIEENIWTIKPLPPQLQCRVPLPHSVAYSGFVPSPALSTATSTESMSMK